MNTVKPIETAALAGAWLPISTAPKDGTFILIIGKDNDGDFWDAPEIAHWQSGGWIEKDSKDNIPFWGVTNWMPFPALPVERKVRGLV